MRAWRLQNSDHYTGHDRPDERDGIFRGFGHLLPTQNDSTTPVHVGDISEFNPATSGGVTQMGYFDMAVTFVMAGLNLVLKVIESIIFIFPTLVNTFGVRSRWRRSSRS